MTAAAGDFPATTQSPPDGGLFCRPKSRPAAAAHPPKATPPGDDKNQKAETLKLEN
jgi:hypothetical protein